MEKIVKAFHEISEINDAYNLSNEEIDAHLKEIEFAKVCTPIIGKFSTGKSALMNTLLGYKRKMLKEDITPETAVPTEIVYGEEDKATLYNNNGSCETIAVQEYWERELDANTITKVRLSLKNSFLEEIPDVMLVDMPGFESGFEIHNKAIDNYLPQSLAYMVAFAADDMIVRSSVGNILKELCLHDMPICVVITKSDKKNDEFQATFDKLKESLKRFVGERPIQYCITSSFIGNADELKKFLEEIQNQSQEILANKFKNCVLSAISHTETYLNTTLKNSEMSESELAEEEEKLEKELNGLNEKYSKEREEFDLEISQCVEEIKSDVQIALEAEVSTFVTIAMNNGNINEQLNLVIRKTVTTSIQKRVIPKVEKYIRRVGECLNGDAIGDVQVSILINMEEISKDMTSSVVSVVVGTLIGGPLIGLLVAGITNILGKREEEKKREEKKREIRGQLETEVFPKVVNEVGNKIQIALTKQIKLINTSIDDEFATQRANLEKAMEDVKGRLHDEQERKENLTIDIKNDLERIGEIRNGL